MRLAFVFSEIYAWLKVQRNASIYSMKRLINLTIAQYLIVTFLASINN